MMVVSRGDHKRRARPVVRVSRVTTRERLVDWWFRNRETGEITIGQPPNPPVIVGAVAFGARVILRPPGLIGTALSAVGTAAAVYWAGDEVLRGVNPYRRVMGAAVLGGIAAVLVRRARS
jgi:hypothetical protein